MSDTKNNQMLEHSLGTKKVLCAILAVILAFSCLFSAVPGSAALFSMNAYAATVKAPAVPKNVKAAAASPDSIKVSWSAVSGATGYAVYRYNTTTKKYAKLATIKTVSYTNKGLAKSKNYSYKVAAYKTSGGKTVYSAQSSAATASIPVPAVPANVKAASASYTSITISWSAVSGASGYVIYRYNDVKKTYDRLTTVTALNYTDKGLVTAKSYSYKVGAFKTIGGQNIYGALSAAVTAVPAVNVPGNVKAASGSYNNVNLSWSAVSGVSGYEVYKLNTTKNIYERCATVKTVSYNDTKLVKDRTYSYKVRAYAVVSGVNLYGAFSAPVSAKAVVKAPVGGTAAQMLEFYNLAANATKAYTGKVKVDVDRTLKLKLNSVSPALVYSIIYSALEDEGMFEPQTETYSYAFENGSCKDGTMIDLLPVSGKPTMSTLPSAGVKSAKCTAKGTGWETEIKLVTEKGSSSAYIPPYHSTCAGIMDFGDFSDIADSFSVSYDGATIKAVVNKNGYLDTLSITEPVTETVSITDPDSGMTIKLNITSTLSENYKFTY